MAMDLKPRRHWGGSSCGGGFEPLDHQVVMYQAVQNTLGDWAQAHNTLSAAGVVFTFSINEDGTISPVLRQTTGPQWVLADGGLLP
eukprot:239729-Prymnesium_polylepis.1